MPASLEWTPGLPSGPGAHCEEAFRERTRQSQRTLSRIQWYGVKTRLLGNIIWCLWCRTSLYYSTDRSVGQEAQPVTTNTLLLWRKAPGNPAMRWPVLWVQPEGIVLTLVCDRSQNKMVKAGFPRAKPEISCACQLTRLFKWDQTETPAAWSAGVGHFCL